MPMTKNVTRTAGDGDDHGEDGGRRPESTHRPLSSSFLGLPYRILNINHKKELLRGLCVSVTCHLHGLQREASPLNLTRIRKLEPGSRKLYHKAPNSQLNLRPKLCTA